MRRSWTERLNKAFRIAITAVHAPCFKKNKSRSVRNAQKQLADRAAFCTAYINEALFPGTACTNSS